MHCASCATIITKALKKEYNITSSQINVALKQLQIDQEDSIHIDDLNATLTKYWYSLSQETPNVHTKHVGSDMQSSDWNDAIAYRKMLLSVTLAILAMLSMLYMVGIDYERRPKNLIIHHLMKGFLPIAASVMLTVIWRKYIIAITRYIKYGVANMDTLVGIGTVTAFIYSFVASTLHDVFPDILGKQVFYEAVVVVIWFIELGKYLEEKVMNKTWQAIKSLLWLQVKSALLIKNNEQTYVPIEQVTVWDIMLVKPWEKIPLDGIIYHGSAYIDESMITGEPVPASKTPWDIVIWWTICSNSTIQVQATAIWSETYLQKIISIVEQAQSSKPAIQKLADSIMQYFVPTVLIIALLSACFRILLGNQFFPWINGFQFGLMTFVGVLVIACPCGLGLATPMAVITGIWHGAKNGILAKNAEWLLKLRKANIVIFDKTGTITEGKPQLVEMSNSDSWLLSILASLESLSSHPIAQAVASYAKQHNIALQEVTDYKNLEWIGVQWTIHDIPYTICKLGYLEKIWLTYDNARIDQRTKQWKTPLMLTDWKVVLWYYAVADQIKETSKQAIHQLQEQSIIPVMLTWDHENTAAYIASLVGITNIHAWVTPEQKAAIVKQYQLQWIVCMVGDGINDAPALATADIWVAMSTGTDVAIESAELTLLHGDLNKLVKAIAISKLTQSAIIQNLSWAFGFNLIWIPLAAWLFYPVLGVLLNPAFEGIAMSMSSLTVMLNSLRLQTKNIWNNWWSRKWWLWWLIAAVITVSFLWRGISRLINPDIIKSSFGSTNVTSFLSQEVVYIASEWWRVDIINASWWNVVDSILLSWYSIHNVYFHKDKKMLYISANAMAMEWAWASMWTSVESDFLLVFDSISHKIIAKISLWSNNNLSHVALSEDGKYLLINHQDKWTTSIMDWNSYKFLWSYEWGKWTKPHGMRISPNNKAYIALMWSKALGVLDISQNTGYTVSLRWVPVQVALTKDGAIYTSLYTTRKIAEIIDGEINYISLPWESQGPIQIDVTPNQQYLVVADQWWLNQDERGNTIYLYDRIKKAFTWSVIVGQWPHWVVVEDAAAYITNIADNTVSKVSLESMQVIYTTDVSEEPNWIVRGVY